MATYYVYSGAGGANTGADWANAYTAYGSAVTAATTNGDVIRVHYAHQENLAADTTYTFTANVNTICVDKDSSDAPTVMGAANGWVGHNAANRTISIAGANLKLYFYGLTLRDASTGSDSFQLSVSDGMSAVYEACYIWHGNSSASTVIQFGGADIQSFTHLKNCTLRFGATTQRMSVMSRVLIEGGSVSADGSAPANLIVAAGTDPAGASVEATGWDISHVGAGNVLGDCTTNACTVTLHQCKLGTFPPPMATQTNVNQSSGEIYAFDCATGDTHGLLAYVNPLGTVSSDTGIYFTSGAAAQSWKIVTTSAANFYTPFVTPWFGYYNTGTSAITPYIEILRDGSATAYQDDEVWGEWAAKVTTGSTIATLYSDRMTLLGSPANQAAGAGLGSWTGETTTGAPDAWSGKVAPGSSFTPAENGHIQARVCVGEPSITVYVDPQIRT